MTPLNPYEAHKGRRIFQELYTTPQDFVSEQLMSDEDLARILSSSDYVGAAYMWLLHQFGAPPPEAEQ